MKKQYTPCSINPNAVFQTPKRDARQAADYARWGFHRPATYAVKPLPWWHMPIWKVLHAFGLV